jgi:propanol-preferring alcohol dehydrogenase
MVLHEPGPVSPDRLRLEERRDPDPGPGEIRIRVNACAICRTDLHVIEADLPIERIPVIPGHQVAGVVDRTGPGASRFREGDRAGIAWLRSTCGNCAFCRTGRENLCEGARFTGYHEDGGYAGYAVVPESFAYRIPDPFSDEEVAPLLCAGIIGYRALRRSEVGAGDTLGIFGFGSSAHITLQVAAHLGCRVCVFTRSPERQAQARRMGAGWAGGTMDRPPAPLDGAIVFAPAGEVVPPALRAVRKGATVAIAGIHMSAIPSMSYEPHIFHEKRLTSVTANTRVDGENLLRDAAAVPVRPTVTTYLLEDANRTLVDLKEGRLEGTAVLILDQG